MTVSLSLSLCLPSFSPHPSLFLPLSLCTNPSTLSALTEQRNPLVAKFSNKICNCLPKMKRSYLPVKLEEGRAAIPFPKNSQKELTSFFCLLTMQWRSFLIFYGTTLRSSLISCSYPGLMWQNAALGKAMHTHHPTSFWKMFLFYSVLPPENRVYPLNKWSGSHQTWKKLMVWILALERMCRVA